jgi:hypothetical protein
MIAAAWPLGQSANAETTTDGWRLIGLIAITLATIVVLALIFRPWTSTQGAPGGQPAPDGGEREPAEPNGPRPASAGPTVQTDAELAAERLRQIVQQGRVDRRRPTSVPQAGRGRPTGEEPGKEGAMETGEQGTIEGIEAEQGGLDAEALEEQLRRLFGPQGEPGKIVPFTPRRPPTPEDQERPVDRPSAPGAEPRITRFPVDVATRDGITATIQELLFCSNVGELLHGFALYTDRYLFQFMDDSRMSEDEFRAAFSDIGAKDPSDWTRIDAISDFTRLDDGRVTVRVRYIDGSMIDGTEQFTMRYDPRLERWLIDDIQAI